MKIPETKSKIEYLQQIDELRERRASQLEKRELDIHIK
jgi:hypothetical protein